MARVIADYVEDVRLQMPMAQRREPHEIENCITEALKRTSNAAMLAPYRPALEILVNVTLSARDAYNRQTGTLPMSIIFESVRDGDVTHADVSRPLTKRSIDELTDIYSGSTIGYFAIDNGLIYAIKTGALFTTATAAVVRGVKLLTDVADIPLEVEPFFVAELLSMVMGLPGEMAA